MRPAESQHILNPPFRARKIFFGSLAAHFLTFVLPMLLAALMEWMRPEKPEDLTVNLVDDPSVGPVVAHETTRLPPSPVPEPKVNPPPIPPKPVPPDEPVLADLPIPPPPEPVLTDLPAPALPPKPRPKAPPEPRIKLPKIAKNTKPATPPKPDRKLENTRKTGIKSGSLKNQDIPIGGKDAGQKYGDKHSDTPDGGPRNDARNAALLGKYLKNLWDPFTPAWGLVKDTARPEVEIWLEVSGDGRLLTARIVRPSGSAVMDRAAMRFLESLRSQTLPRPKDGRTWGHNFILRIPEPRSGG